VPDELTRYPPVRTDAPGQSALLMLDVADILVRQGVSYVVVGAMAAAVHGVVRASLDADALVLLQVREAASLRRSFDAAGFITELRIGDPDDPIPALLDLRDAHGNRVDLLIGLRGLDPEALSRASEVAFLDGVLRIVGREDLIAMKLFAGGPQDLADARAALQLDQETLDMELLRRLSARFGRSAARALETLLAEQS
jgi:hypothetical protein